jgi:putative transposase
VLNGLPKTAVRLGLAHMVRHRPNCVKWKLREGMAINLMTVYALASVCEASIRLDVFDDEWDAGHPTIVEPWRSNWARITPFFACTIGLMNLVQIL